MGVVLRARRQPDGEVVALKVLRAELAADDVYRRRFAHEVRAAGGAASSHLVKILDAGEVQGRPYIAMSYVQGIVHRDIKPSNVLFGDEDSALLTDFGLAKGRAYTLLTRPGQAMGTLDYMAPELIRGQPASPATDLYALGCVVYECIAGTPPFGDRSMFEIGTAHLEEEPPDLTRIRPETTTSLHWVIGRALAKDPNDRPSTGTAYAHMLQMALR